LIFKFARSPGEDSLNSSGRNNGRKIKKVDSLIFLELCIVVDYKGIKKVNKASRNTVQRETTCTGEEGQRMHVKLDYE
jgi:hypothetical protein